MTAAVVGIFGPTASGKSAVAEAVAERMPAELVSADSTQVYRDVPLLTNQSPAHLVAIWELDHEGSVADYQRLAHAAIDEVLARARTPIVVGGTGLYFRAAAPRSFAEVMQCDRDRFNRFFHAMLEQGVYLAPSAYEAGFVSSAHGPEEIEATLAAARRSFKTGVE